MAITTADADEIGQPATLHRVMQTMMGDALRRHYQAPKKLSHELFVLLLQLKEEEGKRDRTVAQPRRRRAAPAAEGMPG
jgi:hypothetical protein